jgi:hypothetical protein
LINVSLKSILCDISIATPACFGGATGFVNLLPAFHPKPVFFMSMTSVSCKQQIVGSSFSIQFAKQCPYMRSPLTFSVNIDRCVLIPDI